MVFLGVFFKTKFKSINAFSVLLLKRPLPKSMTGKLWLAQFWYLQVQTNWAIWICYLQISNFPVQNSSRQCLKAFPCLIHWILQNLKWRIFHNKSFKREIAISFVLSLVLFMHFSSGVYLSVSGGFDRHSLRTWTFLCYGFSCLAFHLFETLELNSKMLRILWLCNYLQGSVKIIKMQNKIKHNNKWRNKNKRRHRTSDLCHRLISTIFLPFWREGWNV